MARDLDACLFAPDGWFAIDVDNRRVPGVVVASLEVGLELVGCGSVATVVGRLREELVVVDVDVNGVRGHGVCEAIVAWCTQEGLWHLLRPSGGADGRAHVFVAHDGRLEALEGLLGALRTSYRVARPSIDLRTAVRPLTAPHRRGHYTAPCGPLKDALKGLRRLTCCISPPARRTTQPHRQRPPTVAVEPKRRRQVRDLPEPWALFLRTGQRPALRNPAPGQPPHSRSTWEAICTAKMLQAGWSAEQAWKAIEDAHPAAMDHARQSKHRWTRWVWNRAVQEDDAYAPPPDCSAAVAEALHAAEDRLRDLAWTLPPRQRPALLLVGRAILARAQRNDSLRVPVAERNLVLDTGLTDRKTIRAQLRLLDGPLGELHRCFDPNARESSSHEFEIRDRAGRVSQFPPPSLHTPFPPALPSGAPRTCHQLLSALLGCAEPINLERLTQLAQLTDSPSAEPSPSQVRTTKKALAALVRMGQARCTEAGQWVARRDSPVVTTPGEDEQRAELEATLTAERAAYRARRPGAWSVARAAAIKAQQAKERAWWASLTREEQASRRATWQHTFAGLSVSQQSQVKDKLARRDVGRGIDPATRHDEWVDAWSMDRYLTRSTERELWFRSLPQPLQVAYARAWQEHRARLGISRGTPLAQSRREHANALPDTSQDRDTEFLATQALPVLDLDEALG